MTPLAADGPYKLRPHGNGWALWFNDQLICVRQYKSEANEALRLVIAAYAAGRASAMAESGKEKEGKG